MTVETSKKIDEYLKQTNVYALWENNEEGSLIIKIPYSVASFWEISEYFDPEYQIQFSFDMIRKHVINLEPDSYGFGISKTDDCTIIVIEYFYYEERYYEFLRTG